MAAKGSGVAVPKEAIAVTPFDIPQHGLHQHTLDSCRCQT